MRGASSGAAIEEPRMLSKVRRFTGDDITFLHGVEFAAVTAPG
jgi:hypothetical protein